MRLTKTQSPRYLLLLLLLLGLLVSPVAALGEIDVENLDWATLHSYNLPEFDFAKTTMSYNRIQTSPVNVHNSAVLRIYNRSTVDPLDITALTIANPASYTITGAPALPFTIPASGFQDITVNFVHSFGGGDAGLIVSTLTIASSDTAAPTTVVDLRGYHSYQEGGTSEADFAQTISVMGYTTNIGYSGGTPLGGHPDLGNLDTTLPGDEYNSKFWQRVDMSRPVYIRQLAALHGASTERIDVFTSGGVNIGNVTHLGADYQAFLPTNNAGGGPTEIEINPALATTFEFNVDGETACAAPCAGAQGLRFYPVYAPDGSIVPDSFFFGHDYLGGGTTNFDYNDNIYLVTNIQPAGMTVDLQLLSAADAPDPVESTNNLVYTIQVRNNDTMFSARNAIITLDFPATVAGVISAVSSEGVCNTLTPTLTCNIGRVRPGETIDITVTVDPADTGTPYTLTTDITLTADNDSTAGNNAATLDTQVIAPVAPVISNNNPLNIPIGTTQVINAGRLQATDLNTPPDQLIYTVATLPASGNLLLNGVVLVATDTFTQDDINNGLLAYEHTGVGAGVDNFTFTLTDGTTTLGPETFNITIINPPAPTPVPPTSGSTDGDTQVAASSPSIGLFDPGLSKIGFLSKGDTGVTGETIVWFLTIFNNGSGTGSNIVVTDVVTDDLRVDSVTTSAGTAAVNGQTVTITIPTLGPGQSVQVVITTTVLQGIEVTNTACLTADGVDGERCATAFPVRSLPNTGEAPRWRYAGLLLIPASIIGLWAWIRRRQIQVQ